MKLTVILFFIFLISVMTNLFYWVLWFNMKKNQKDSTAFQENDQNEGVSVVICTKNKIEDLKSNLLTILEQKYPLFEVIVIDDGSTDDTFSWLNQLSDRYNNLRIFFYKASLPGKKQALKMGITKANYDWLLLTDADCRAMSNRWIDDMMESRKVHTQIVLGFGPYEKNSGCLNKLIRYETIITAIQYISAANQGMAYMGVGRNILYHKQVFTDYDEIIKYELASGDDDLLVNAKAMKNNTTVCLTRKSFIYSHAEKTWMDWILQKTRHMSTSYFYKWQYKLLLIPYATSQVGILLMLTFIGSKYFFCALTILLLRWIVIMGRSRQILKRLGASDLWLYVPLLDVALSIYFLLIHPLGFVMNWGNAGRFNK